MRVGLGSKRAPWRHLPRQGLTRACPCPLVQRSNVQLAQVCGPGTSCSIFCAAMRPISRVRSLLRQALSCPLVQVLRPGGTSGESCCSWIFVDSSRVTFPNHSTVTHLSLSRTLDFIYHIYLNTTPATLLLLYDRVQR